MGGRNGGRPATRPQLDGGLKLDLYRLKRQGWLVPDGSTSGTLTWRNVRTGEEISAIGFAITADAESGSARLTYTTTLHSGERIASDYTIDLVSTPQPFGGRRWWFLCPVTSAKAAMLYMPAGQTRFASQAALRGSYRTQRISPRDRTMELAQDINMAMGGNGNLFDAFPEKPPQMHQSTYQRRRERAERAKGQSLAALGAWLDRTSPAWRQSGRAMATGQG